jgi:hypothetical protein
VTGRCPNGDDPMTEGIDDTVCSGVVAEGGYGTGASGNKCYVECSNRLRLCTNFGGVVPAVVLLTLSPLSLPPSSYPPNKL